MIAFAASLLAPLLFCSAAFASALVVFVTVRRYGPDAMTLQAQLKNCPEAIAVTWKVIERVQVPALGTLRKRPARRIPARLEWPGAALDLAA